MLLLHWPLTQTRRKVHRIALRLLAASIHWPAVHLGCLRRYRSFSDRGYATIVSSPQAAPRFPRGGPWAALFRFGGGSAPRFGEAPRFDVLRKGAVCLVWFIRRGTGRRIHRYTGSQVLKHRMDCGGISSSRGYQCVVLGKRKRERSNYVPKTATTSIYIFIASTRTICRRLMCVSLLRKAGLAWYSSGKSDSKRGSASKTKWKSEERSNRRVKFSHSFD